MLVMVGKTTHPIGEDPHDPHDHRERRPWREPVISVGGSSVLGVRPGDFDVVRAAQNVDAVAWAFLSGVDHLETSPAALGLSGNITLQLGGGQLDDDANRNSHQSG